MKKHFRCPLLTSLIILILIPSAYAETEPYSFTYDVIRSFQYCREGQQAVDPEKNNTDMEFMASMIAYRNKMRFADNSIIKHTKSKTKLIKESAERYHMAYSGLMDNQTDAIKYFEKVLNNPERAMQEKGTLYVKFGEYSNRGEELWRLLMMNTISVTYAMLNMKGKSDDSTKRLLITKKEREYLIKELDLVFGDEIKGGLQAGQLPLTASGAILWKFLNEPWVSADQ
jgi:hypothetical protein